ncbi:hypothetical protein WDU94_000407 [Cyamophila willieti]
MDVSRGTTGNVQIKHKKQSSQDSGTFLDWDEPIVTNSLRTISTDGDINFNSNINNGEFVTVVAVEAKNEPREHVDSGNANFVTVLTVNSVSTNEKDVYVEKTVSVNNETVDLDENRNVSSARYVNRASQNGNNGMLQGHVVRNGSQTDLNSNEIVSHNDSRHNFRQGTDQYIESEILVYRLPGERLGFGLKFEGGLQTNQKVARLFVQSCAEDSPASRTITPWGHFVPGDELVRINEIDIRELTRIDCVKYLKELTVVLKLYVRHLKSPSDVDETCHENQETRRISDGEHPNNGLGCQNKTVDNQKPTQDKVKGNGELVRKVTNDITHLNTIEKDADLGDDNSSPPPIPPRKLLRKNSTSLNERRLSSPKASPRSIVSNDTSNVRLNSEQQNNPTNDDNEKEFYEVDFKLSDQDIDEIIDSLDRSESEEAARNEKESRRVQTEQGFIVKPGKLSILDINDNVQSDLPAGLVKDLEVPEAEYYTNLFLDSNDTLFESESDDTGSSHTTAIDRLSLHSSDRISLTSSSSISDIKSLNSYEFELDSNMDTVIDFDKVLEPLEGAVETLPIENGAFMMKTVVHEEQTIKKSGELGEKVTEKILQPIRSDAQDNLKVKGETDKTQSPKPLPRTDIQKLKFKSGKKMPPPPPPPVKKEENHGEHVTQNAIEYKRNSSPKNVDISLTGSSKNSSNTSAGNPKTGENTSVAINVERKHFVSVENPTVSPREKVTGLNKDTTPSQPENIIKNARESGTNLENPNLSPDLNMKESKDLVRIERKKISSNVSTNETTRETSLYTTVEQISVDHYPKVIKTQEKVPLDASSPTYKSELSILETIVENDEHNNHLPRLIDFVPKDKVKSTAEKSKKLSSIIFEQQKVVEYFTQHSSTNGKSVNKTVKREMTDNHSKTETTQGGVNRGDNKIKNNVTNVSKTSNDVKENQTTNKKVTEQAGATHKESIATNVCVSSVKESENANQNIKEIKADLDGSHNDLHCADREKTSVISSKDVGITESKILQGSNDIGTTDETETNQLEMFDRKADGGERADEVDGNDHGQEGDGEERKRSGMIQDLTQPVQLLEHFNKGKLDHLVD